MKKIIITGCSNGFGLLTAKHLAKLGHTVYATMRNVAMKNRDAAEGLSTWAKENGTDVIVTEMDVTSDASVEKAIAEIALHSGGQIDVVINNAGFGSIGLVEEFSNEQLNDVFQTMVFGPNRVIKATLPYMHQKHSGLLILLSSRSSAFQIPFGGTYSAAKAAAHALANAYSYELRSTGIESVIVQAGNFQTGIGDRKFLADNEAVAEQYGEWYTKAKAAVTAMYTISEIPQDNQLVPDLIDRIIATPSGQRDIIYPVGLKDLEAPLKEINKLSAQISETLIKKIGI
jgi:NAD(P)-dependent dehydrogenase (short-subunit alcohol dehydrogenase family)